MPGHLGLMPDLHVNVINAQEDHPPGAQERQSASGLSFPATCRMSVVNSEMKARWRCSLADTLANA